MLCGSRGVLGVSRDMLVVSRDMLCVSRGMLGVSRGMLCVFRGMLCVYIRFFELSWGGGDTPTLSMGQSNCKSG